MINFTNKEFRALGGIVFNLLADKISVQSSKAEDFQAMMKLDLITWTDVFPEVIDKECFCIDIIGYIWLFQIDAGSVQATQNKGRNVNLKKRWHRPSSLFPHWVQQRTSPFLHTHTHTTLSQHTDVPHSAENPNHLAVAARRPSTTICPPFLLIHPSANSKAPQFNLSN